MNRRGFLGSLLALGALPVLAKLPMLLGDHYPDGATLLVEGDGILCSYQALGEGGLSEMATVSMFAGLREVYRDAFNVANGFWHVPYAGQGVIFSRAQPLSIVLSRNAACEVRYKAGGEFFSKAIDKFGVVSPPLLLHADALSL